MYTLQKKERLSFFVCNMFSQTVLKLNILRIKNNETNTEYKQMMEFSTKKNCKIFVFV